MKKHLTYIFLFTLVTLPSFGQETGTIKGEVTVNNQPLPYASVQFLSTNLGTTADNEGNFILENVPAGKGVLKVRLLGYQTFT